MVQIRFNHQQGYRAETMEQCVKLDHQTVGQQQKSSKCRYCIWLVVEPPLWKIWVRQLEWWLFPICGKIKIVPNHQPGIYMWYIYSLSLQFPYHVWSLNMSRSWLVVFFWARHDPLDIAEWLNHATLACADPTSDIKRKHIFFCTFLLIVISQIPKFPRDKVKEGN